MNLFDLESTPFRFPKDKKIKIFTTFSGIGCQEMALSKITKNYEVLGFAEIDNHAIKSYLAIHGNIKNYGDICKINGIDLPKEIDIFTYSFPCTDLSKVGKQKGLNSETRSGLVFEVLRLLKELKAEKNLPKVLIMENVPDLLSSKFKDGWHTIYNEIEAMGYENYVSILNAKDYGIPQNRNRVFMISVPKGYYYEFPDKTKLVIKLKDLLEDEVDKKYYLSEKMLHFLNDETNRNGLIRKKQFRPHKIDESDIAFTITTKAGSRPTDNFIEVFDLSGQPFIKVPQATKTTKVEQMPLIIDIGSSDRFKQTPKKKAKYGVVIPSKTKKGYEIAEDGDGVYINRPYQKRGTVQKSMIPTLKTSCADIGIVDGYRIRKITPLECWRLMGILDEDFHKAKNAGVSNSQLFKQAGNGIVVNVMEAILKQLF